VKRRQEQRATYPPEITATGQQQRCSGPAARGRGADRGQGPGPEEVTGTISLLSRRRTSCKAMNNHHRGSQPPLPQQVPWTDITPPPAEGYAGGASPSMDVSNTAGTGGASSVRGYGTLLRRRPAARRGLQRGQPQPGRFQHRRRRRRLERPRPRHDGQQPLLASGPRRPGAAVTVVPSAGPPSPSPGRRGGAGLVTNLAPPPA
jgi:hypothetical protein